ncbi:MAG TPA: methyltransferase domain-containing protein [Chloroflexota bacterium]|nr:methyltransferase domain-containing protein [Chloroflexota bacterium]
MSVETLSRPPDAAGPETPAWLSAHYEEPYHQRRTAKLPRKLAKLGVLDLPRGARVLDACCGKGEALALLRRHGYQNLIGVDGHEHADWSRVPGARFVASEAQHLPFADGEFDAVLILHALHHLRDPQGVQAFLDECSRVLKPGGRLFILDFPGSPLIRLLFWLLRTRVGAVTPGLRNFARILDEEWSYLAGYLHEWGATRAVLECSSFEVERHARGLFLYYLTLVKPGRLAGIADPWQEESESWLASYTDDRWYRRRKAEMRPKLEWLGLDRADRKLRIYDMCCGTGEGLETLYEMGYRDLHGIDITAYPNLLSDARFDIQQCDVRSVNVPDESVDWVLNIHALHHLQNTDNVRLFLDECYRILKPGGRLSIVDFPGSPQIHLAFRCFLIKSWLVTPYLRWFGSLIQSEWHFLPGYLAQWPRTRKLIFDGKFQVVSRRDGFFYYYVTLCKPERS